MSAQPAAVTAENLSPIQHHKQKVITTALLAQLYGTSSTNIQSNFNRNKGRFAKGKHYFLLKGTPLKSFKNDCTISAHAGIAKTVNQLTLWTERGAARHAKMLDTDQAWDVFERLEDCYFSRDSHTDKALPLPCSLTLAHQRKIQQLVANKIARANSGRNGYSQIYSAIKDRYLVPSYKEVPESEFNDLVQFVSDFYVIEAKTKELPVIPQIVLDALSSATPGDMWNIRNLCTAVSLRVSYNCSVSIATTVKK